VLRLKATAPAGGQRYNGEAKKAGRDAGGTEGRGNNRRWSRHSCSLKTLA
jgi:hypothetical protein